MASTLIFGLGNPILRDDVVGLRVARELGKRLANQDVEVIEASVGGLEVLDFIVGYEKVIVVDAIQTKNGKIGDVHKLNIDDFQATVHIDSPHSMNFPTAIEFGKKLGLEMPKQIIIYGIEVKDIRTFSEECTPEVEAAIPKIVEEIMADIAR